MISVEHPNAFTAAKQILRNRVKDSFISTMRKGFADAQSIAQEQIRANILAKLMNKIFPSTMENLFEKCFKEAKQEYLNNN